MELVLKNDLNRRDAKWTESIVVGGREFAMATKAKPGARAIGRQDKLISSSYTLAFLSRWKQTVTHAIDCSRNPGQTATLIPVHPQKKTGAER